MSTAQPHAVYPRAAINSYAGPLIKERIQAWSEFLDSDLARPSPAHSAADSSTSTARSSATSRKQRSAIDHVLSYKAVNMNLFQGSLQLDLDHLPSCCRQQQLQQKFADASSSSTNSSNNSSSSSSSSSNSVSLVPLSHKVAQVAEIELTRRKKDQQAAANKGVTSSASHNNSAALNAEPLFNVAEIISRALEALQYAHMAKLIHGRVCADAFYVSSVEMPWAPTLCLGELPLVAQFFVDMGQALDTEVRRRNAAPEQAAAEKHLLSWPHLVAPEITNRDVFDESVDVWGVGVLTVQLCMASLGYPREIWAGGALKSAELADATLMSPRLSGLPPGAVSFATMCLKKNPASRPTIAGLLSHPWIRMYARIAEATQGPAAAAASSPSPARHNGNDDDYDDDDEDAKATAEAIAQAAAGASSSARQNKSAFRGALQPSKVRDVINVLRQIRGRIADGDEMAHAGLPGASVVNAGAVQRRMRMQDLIAAGAANDDDEEDDEEEDDEEEEEEEQEDDSDDEDDDDSSSSESD